MMGQWQLLFDPGRYKMKNKSESQESKALMLEELTKYAEDISKMRKELLQQALAENHKEEIYKVKTLSNSNALLRYVNKG